MMSESDADGDALLRNVSLIRQRLLQTEKNLQMLQTPRSNYRYAASSDGDSMADDEQPLTLDELAEEFSDVGLADGGARVQVKGQQHPDAVRGVHNIDRQHPMHPPKNVDAPHGSGLPIHDFENESLRKKLQALRDENSQLITSNHKLLSELESTTYELRSTKSQLKVVTHELDTTREEVPTLRHKLSQLESSIQLDNEALRSADHRLVEYERELKDKKSVVRQCREEVKAVQSELAYETQQRERAEYQRDQTLGSLEDLSDQLNEYRNKTKEKFKKFQDTEDRLRDNLLHSDQEREELLDRATALEGELQDARDSIRELKEGSIREKAAATQDLQSSVFSLQSQVARLQDELDGRSAENASLRELSDRQTQRLAGCQRDMEASHSEVRRLQDVARRLQDSMRHSGESGSLQQTGFDNPGPLRASSPASSDPGTLPRGRKKSTSPASSTLSAKRAYSVSWEEEEEEEVERDHGGQSRGGSNRELIAQLRMKLAMKEAENQRLQAARQRDTAGLSLSGSGTMDGLRSELTALVERNKIGDRKAQELGTIINRLEEERRRQAGQLTRLQERLAEQEAHSTAVESQLDHYNSQLRVLHDQAQQRGERVTALEAELEEKRGLVRHLEEHLGEKSLTMEQSDSKLAQLDDQLAAKTTELQDLKLTLERKAEEASQLSQTLDEMKELHSQQSQEMQQQMERLQDTKDALTSQVQDMSRSREQLQGELSAQMMSNRQLEKDLEQTRQELDEGVKERRETAKSMKQKASEDGYRITQLEAALLVCKEELTGYINRIEDMRDRHEKAMQDKKTEIKKLELLLRQTSEARDESESRALALERSVEEQQQMLLQSAERMAELEEKEGHLEHQVSHLEKGLNHVTTAAENDAALIEKKLHQACVDLEDRAGQLTETREALDQAQSKLAEAAAQLSDLEQRLSESKADSGSQAAKASQLEADLREAKQDLELKTDRVAELEGTLEDTRQENLAHHQRSQELDGELRRAQLEMQTTAQQLTDLQRLLQRSRAEAKHKQQRMQELSEELRRSQTETRNRDQNMAEMDDVLQSSQRELQEKAAQVSQLDRVAKEKEAESQQTILQLETSLSKSQYEVKQCSRKIAELEDSLDEQREALKERALQTQQLEQASGRQKADVKHKEQEIAQMKKRIEDLSQQCSSLREGELAQGQELRLAKEQSQRHHVELTEARRQLAQLKREKDQLAREYDDALQLCRRRDDDHARLAEEHGLVMAREAETETIFGAELERIRDLQGRELESKERELAELQEKHADLLAAKGQLEAGHRLEINGLKDAEASGRREAARLGEEVANLEADLRAQKEVIQATNEAIVIKEAEVARLNARLSGYERATFGLSIAAHGPQSSRLSTPSRGAVPYLVPSLLAPASQQQSGSPRTPLRRSASDDRLARSATAPHRIPRDGRPPELNGAQQHGPRGHARHPTDSGLRFAYGSPDYLSPPPTHARTRCDPRSSRVGDGVSDRPATLGHFSDADSAEEEDEDEAEADLQSFQGMLSFVNRQLAGLHRPDESAAHGDASVSALSSQLGGQSLLADTSREDSDLAMDLSELQDTKGPSWEGDEGTSRKVYNGRASSRDGIRRSSPGRAGSQGHRPKIMKSPGQSSESSPNTLPLKKRLATQRAKMAATKSAADKPLRPEDCMADLQDRLRANDERRRRIDDQLYNMRDHARKITNRILGKGSPQ